MFPSPLFLGIGIPVSFWQTYFCFVSMSLFFLGPILTFVALFCWRGLCRNNIPASSGRRTVELGDQKEHLFHALTSGYTTERVNFQELK